MSNSNKRNRRQARQYVFQTLYANEFHNTIDEMVFPEGYKNGSMDATYVKKTLQGIIAHMQDIDMCMQSFLNKRRVEHLDRIDRAILRLAIYEIKFSDDRLAPSIIINEAVQLAQSFASTSSYRFINGVLDSIVKSK